MSFLLDLDFDPMTLIPKFDLDMIKMYLDTLKIKFLAKVAQKL